MTPSFEEHIRCLMATGSTARQARESLILNAAHFLGRFALAYPNPNPNPTPTPNPNPNPNPNPCICLEGLAEGAAYCREIPRQDWFVKQREALGSESFLYTFMRIAACDKFSNGGLTKQR